MTGRGPTIALEGVSRCYGNVVAVNEISFEVAPGITGLLGPNGAGKSTLLHALGLPAAVGGVRRGPWRVALAQPRDLPPLGLVPERESVYGHLTGYDFVLLNARLQGLPIPTRPRAARSRRSTSPRPRSARPAATRRG